MQHCYLCNKPFDGDAVQKHDEHIIQNALGGKLIGAEILCEACGNILNAAVDVPFIRELEPVSVLLRLARDRGGACAANAGISSSHGDLRNVSNIQFWMNNDFAVAPSKPILLQDQACRKVTVIAATNALALAFAQSKAVATLASKGYGVEVGTNLAAYIEKAILQVRSGAIEVQRGVLKIAIEFALQTGVARHEIAHLLGNGNLTTDAHLLRGC
ncbi:HNH endonuclease [Archangium lipolyticum]|uniref:HNH endonuclease n=1 Tax=Archangium lipolyticum TaxID=2970465 RepID=UPI00214C6231|nr:HNH endonuclease [Archangium lipolyticum]